MTHGFDIIDAHQHLGPSPNFHIRQNDAAGMIAEMDRLGIRQGWMSAHASIYGHPEIGNEDVAETVRAYPGRFLGYVVADPNYPEDVALELERRMAQPEFKMIKLHPSLMGYPIDGPNNAPIWEIACEYNCPVLTHAWPADTLCGPRNLRRVMENHPGVHLIFGHALFHTVFEEAARLARDYENIVLDIATSNHCYGMIEYAVKTAGAERITFGSDMPFISAAGAVGKVLYARISDDDKAKILSGNAQRLLDGVKGNAGKRRAAEKLEEPSNHPDSP